MNWFDIILVVVVLLVAVVEAKRGFGRALFDLAALLLTAWGLSRIEPLWADAHFSSHQNAAFFAGSFIIIGGLLIMIGRMVHNATLMSVYPFDLLLGGILGVAVAIVVCHGIVHTLVLTAGPGALPATLECSALGKEFATFDTYNKVLYVLYHFDSTRDPAT